MTRVINGIKVTDSVHPIAGVESAEMRANLDMHEFLGEVFQEYGRATLLHGGFNSAHEAYGVLLEEVDEFWEEVRKKRSERSRSNMRQELVQIAAMAMKAALTIA